MNSQEKLQALIQHFGSVEEYQKQVFDKIPPMFVMVMDEQGNVTAEVTEVYTSSWGIFRKLLAEEGNNEILIPVINFLLEMMEKQAINVLEAAHIKSTELETPGGKMLVMAASVEILLGKFQPGQVVSVEQLQPWPNA